jgi:alpha-ketoglutarate-dependent 2,4-dichlorophenoxyacetate dioxygenase
MPHATQNSIKVTPLGKTFVCEVSGVDFSQPLSTATFNELNAIIAQYGVVILRKTSFTDHSLIAFASRFGDLDNVKQHYINNEKAMRIPLFEIFDVSNLNEKNEIIDPASDPGRQAGANGNATWHADGAFNPRRTGLSMLRGVEFPPKGMGGHTEYADSRSAYEDLDEGMKERIEEYVTCNSIYHNRKVANPDSPLFKDIDVMKNISARHRLVQTHEGSGRKNLYITSYAHHIEGLPIEEGQKLLDELREHCKKEKYRYDLQWENPGDVAIWDNTAVLHRATHGAFEGKYRRDVRRVSVFDMTKWGYGLNSVEDTVGQMPSQ